MRVLSVPPCSAAKTLLFYFSELNPTLMQWLEAYLKAYPIPSVGLVLRLLLLAVAWSAGCMPGMCGGELRMLAVSLRLAAAPAPTAACLSCVAMREGPWELVSGENDMRSCC